MKNKKQNVNHNTKSFAMYGLLILVMFGAIYFYGASKYEVHDLTYDAFMKEVTEGKVEEIEITPKAGSSVILIEGKLDDVVMHYAKNTKLAGLDGVVCSPLEAGKVKEACGQDFITVTPGVRFETDDVGDQVRVTTPKRAKEIGSDYIVVGRPITKSENPVEAYRRCVRDFCE